MRKGIFHQFGFKAAKSTYLITAFAFLGLVANPANAVVIAQDMVGSTSMNLMSHTNPFDGAFASAGDGFQKYRRGVSPTIPFAVLDDSLTIFLPDSLGIIKEGNTDEFFGIVDTENIDNSGAVSATWVFDISGASNLDYPLIWEQWAILKQAILLHGPIRSMVVLQ